jgi:glycosyltransferase involved in cell wall biosynthesis
MRILQIVGNSAYGGASYLILEWCRYLLERGCEVDVLATDPVFSERLSALNDLHVLEEVVIPRDIKPGPDIRALFDTMRLLRHERYDIVHTYTATPGFIGRIASRLVGVPVILHHQAGWTVTEFSSLRERLMYTPLEYLATLASTKSICVSHAVARQARQLHIASQRKLVTICNGIDPEPFISATRADQGHGFRRDLDIMPHEVLIGNTGRLALQKDNATLILALAHLKGLLPERSFRLVLAGEGTERENLGRLAQTLGISKDVYFLGFYTEIPTFLAALNIFVSASFREGLSISLLEAMASARPIVTTSILPNAELIEHEVTGLLVPPKSPKQLALAIVRLINEPELAERCALTARERVLERYTIDRMFQETWDLYVTLLQRQRENEV